MGVRSARRPCAVFAAVALAASLGNGCGASHRAQAPVHTARAAGMTFSVPPGWHRVAMTGIVGADPVLTLASFRPSGSLKTICDPHALTEQIPRGGALLQVIVRRPAEAGLRQMWRRDEIPRVERPFHLAPMRTYECGEAYNTTFRKASRVLQLRVWTTPGGLSASVRGQIGRIVDSLRPALGSSPAATFPPVAGRTVGFRVLRRAILKGVAADFRAGTGAGPPGFEQCLMPKLRRVLDDGALASLVAVYRRRAGQQFAAQALNQLAGPPAAACGGSRFVPEMIAASEALRLGHPAGHARSRLQVSYGPYLGVRCRRPNSTRCERVGLDVVLKRRARSVTASIAERTISLVTPGLHSGVRGEDWVGSFAHVGFGQADSPFRIRGNGRAPGIWAGYPPVYVPVRISVTYRGGRHVSSTFGHVFLSPGWG